MEMVGRRVRLVWTDDRSPWVKPGNEGVVVKVDSLGTVHVRWDSGAVLGLFPDVDRWEYVD